MNKGLLRKRRKEETPAAARISCVLLQLVRRRGEGKEGRGQPPPCATSTMTSPAVSRLSEGGGGRKGKRKPAQAARSRPIALLLHRLFGGGGGERGGRRRGCGFVVVLVGADRGTVMGEEGKKATSLAYLSVGDDPRTVGGRRDSLPRT